MRFTISKMTVVAGLMAMTGAALGGTLAWYHFDELAVGTRATADTRFLNAVDSTFAPARPASISGTTLGTTASRLPQGAEGLPSTHRVRNPATGTSYTPNQSLFFTSATHDAYGAGGAVLIDNDSRLNPSSFTVEFFYRFDGTGEQCWQYLISKKITDGSNKRVTFSIMQLNGRFLAQLGGVTNNSDQTTSVYITSTEKLQTDGSGLYGFKDGNWHHVALTFDGTTHVASLYADYMKFASYTLPSAIAWDATTPFIVGAYQNEGWGRTIGCIDELRFSDVALTPAEFLRAEPITPEPIAVLPETVVYHRFGGSYNVCTGGALFRNDAPEDVSFGFPNLIKSAGQKPVFTNELPMTVFATNSFGSAFFTNRSAIAFRTTESSRATNNRAYSWAFLEPGVNLSSDDFTAELFLRVPPSHNKQTYLLTERSSWYLSLDSGGQVRVSWKETGVSVADGKWHHVAMVYRKDLPEVRAYVDHRLVKTFAAGGNLTLPLNSAGNGSVTVAGYEEPYYNETVLDMEMDDLRITRKALEPSEFLHPSRKDVYWELDFESNALSSYGANWAFSRPIVSKLVGGLTNEVPGAVRSEGLLGETATNTAAFGFANGTSRAGGIWLTDPDGLLPRSSFTAELFFRADVGACESFYDDCVYLFCDNTSFFLRYNRDGRLRFCYTDWTDIAVVPRTEVDTGEWHHVAYVNDVEHSQVRTYFDYALVGTKNQAFNYGAAATNLFIGCGCWDVGNCKQYSFGTAQIDHVRVSKGALKPCEFLTPRHLDAPTLHWAAFEGGMDVGPDTGIAVTGTCAAAALQRDNPGKLLDGSGVFVRENHGSLRASSGGAWFARNSLLERADQTVEFFLRGSGAEGTDFVSLAGDVAGKPIWAVRQVNGRLAVVATDANGVVSTVANAGPVEGDWSHVAIVFAPSADGSTTTVTTYRGYLPAGQGTFAGTLAVDGVSTSNLVVGDFDGAVDELRVSLGALSVEHLLHARRDATLIVFR